MSAPLPCEPCHGKGEIPFHGDNTTFNAPGWEEPCERIRCENRDYHIHRDCEACRGKGVVPCNNLCKNAATGLDAEGGPLCTECLAEESCIKGGWAPSICSDQAADCTDFAATPDDYCDPCKARRELEAADDGPMTRLLYEHKGDVGGIAEMMRKTAIDLPNPNDAKKEPKG